MRRAHRRTFLALATAAFCLASVVAVVGRHGSHGDVRKAAQAQLDKVIQKRVAARARWLHSAKAREQRARSRRAYAGLGRDQVASVVRRKFPATVNSVKSMVQPHDVKRYLSDYTAIVDKGPGAKAAGGTALAVSSVPLRTRHRKPVDLSLRARRGGLGPANALSDFTLPSNLRDPIELTGGVGLSVGSGAAAGVSPERIGSGSALYPNVAKDTDVLASASPRGLELFRLVRSPRSPASESLRLHLPAGTSLRQVQGAGVALVRAGKTELSIANPTAVDAQGRGVPVTMSVRGDTLRITLQRGNDDWAYPILVDPAVDLYVWADFPGWGGFNTGNYSLAGDCMFGRSCFGAGLNIYAWQNQFYVAGDSAGFTYQAPSNPGVFIADAVLGQVGYYTNDSITPPYMWMGLWDTAYNSENTTHALLNSFWFGTFDLPRAGDSPSVKQVRVELSNIAGGYTHTAKGDHHAYVGSATIYLDDNGIPGFGSISRPPWVDKTPAPIPLTVSDTGLGIAGFTLTAAGGSPSWQTSVGCAGGNRSPCPTTWSSPANGSLNYDPSVLPQGVNNLALTATDAAGHASGSGNNAQIRVDHTDPTLDLSGSLADLSQSQSGGN